MSLITQGYAAVSLQIASASGFNADMTTLFNAINGQLDSANISTGRGINASLINAGAFATGAYTFPGNLTVLGALTASSGSSVPAASVNAGSFSPGAYTFPGTLTVSGAFQAQSVYGSGNVTSTGFIAAGVTPVGIASGDVSSAQSATTGAMWIGGSKIDSNISNPGYTTFAQAIFSPNGVASGAGYLPPVLSITGGDATGGVGGVKILVGTFTTGASNSYTISISPGVLNVTVLVAVANSLGGSPLASAYATWNGASLTSVTFLCWNTNGTATAAGRLYSFIIIGY